MRHTENRVYILFKVPKYSRRIVHTQMNHRCMVHTICFEPESRVGLYNAITV